MNYREAMQFVRAADALGCTPGLSRVSELLERLGNPQNQLRCIHIAGTNGKGSTAAMLASVLQVAGYRTGLYTTPHLISYRERICVDGEQITENDFCRAAEIVRDAADGMRETPSEFERFTPMAFVHFLQKKCDIAVIETGMGGRLDATNVIENPELDVIVHVAMDHMDYLGDTIEKIAAEKAGIIKPETDVILMKQSEAAGQIIRERFESVNCAMFSEERPKASGSIKKPEFCITDPDQMIVSEYGLDGFRFSYRGRKDLFLPMAGSFQQQNVMVVLDAVDLLCRKGWKISEEAVREGLNLVHWPARFEILQRQPLVLLDGAHNADGMRALTETLKALIPDRKPVVVMGVLADKEYQEMLQMILPLAGTFIAAAPDQIRALPAERMVEEARSCLQKISRKRCAPYDAAGETDHCQSEAIPVFCGGTICNSLKLACSLCPPDGVICIAGSLYQAGEVRRFFTL